jgi:hypothetical protein
MQTTLVLLSRDKLQEELARQLSLLAFDIFVNIRVRRRRRSFILCCLAFFFFWGVLGYWCLWSFDVTCIMI